MASRQKPAQSPPPVPQPKSEPDPRINALQASVKELSEDSVHIMQELAHMRALQPDASEIPSRMFIAVMLFATGLLTLAAGAGLFLLHERLMS